METRLTEASTRQKEAESRIEEAKRDNLRLQVEKEQIELEKQELKERERERRFPVLFSWENLSNLLLLTITTFVVTHVFSIVVGIVINVRNFHLLNFMLYIRPEMSMFIMCTLYTFCDFLNKFCYKFITRSLED